MPSALALPTSFREVTAEETWAKVQPLARVHGVVRVTDITRLDTIGLPVFSAIRPVAHPRSLSVSSGKGYDVLSARLGALCEAIELSCAEYHDNRPTYDASAGDLQRYGYDAYDLGVASTMVRRLPSTTRFPCVAAVDIRRNLEVLVPADLVFFPFPDGIGGEVFLGSTNGISGGNSVAEATLHGLLEVIERDALTMSSIDGLERRLTDFKQTGGRDLLIAIEASGFRLHVTESPSLVGMSLFIAYIFDPAYEAGVAVARGQGLHFDRDIGLRRAITEAVQSRLTNIHGGRDDIVRRFTHYQKEGRGSEREGSDALERRILALPTIGFHDLARTPIGDLAVDDVLQQVSARLDSAGVGPVLVYPLNQNSGAYPVVRVIVPGAEYYSRSHRRVGRRLIERAAAAAT